MSKMISITLNNDVLHIDSTISLKETLQNWGYDVTAIAVAVNAVLVARKQYENTLLKNGDKLDIVSAMQGG